MADGSIVIDTRLDNSKLQKELDRTIKEINSLEEKIAKLGAQKIPLEDKLRRITGELDEAKAALAGMRSAPKGAYEKADIADQTARVRLLQAEFTKTANSVDSIDGRLQAAEINLDNAKEKAGALYDEMGLAAKGTENLSRASKMAEKRILNISKRLKSLAASALFFSAITAALTALRKQTAAVVRSNADASAAIARLKGALLTLAAPIIQKVIPAFTALVDVITRVVNAISRLLSMLFGMTAEESAKAAESLYEQQKALKGVGSAAKKAGGSLASFDEINKLSSESSGGVGGGGVSSDSDIAPDFKNLVSSSLSAILELFTGAALLSLGAILAFSGANVPLGLSLMALGALAVWDAVSTNWDVIKNLLQGAIGDAVAITSTVLLAFGALLAFSGANIPLGIGMILAGAIGLASVAAANWDTMRDTIAESIGKVLTVIGAGLLAIGAILAFSGVKVALGIGMMVAGAAALAVGSAALNWDAITSNVQTAIGKILQIAGASLLVLGLLFVLTSVNIPLGLGFMVAGGAALGVGAAILNWDAIREKFSEVWSGIKQWWNSHCAKYFTKDYWANLGQSIIDGLLSGLKSAFEAVKTWVSNAVDWVKSQFTGAKSAASITPNGFNSASGNSQQTNFPIIQSIPALARGAVIPPNREFLAVLGDQRSGTNIETPLATMVQAFKQALAESGYSGSSEAVLVLDRDVLGRVVYQLNKAEGNRIGVSLTGV